MSGNNGGETVKMKPMMTIYLTEKHEVYVGGPLEKRELCLSLLHDAKGIVEDFKPPVLVTPRIQGMMDFARKRFK